MSNVTSLDRLSSQSLSCCNKCNGQNTTEVSHLGRNKNVRSIRCTKLHELCIQGVADDELKGHILKCPLSPRSIDRFGRSPLFWAIKLGRSDEIVRHIYHEAPDMLSPPDVYGKTCLDMLYAPRTRNVHILCWLLEQNPALILSQSPSPLSIPLLHRICIRWSLSRNVDAVDLEIVRMTIDAAHRYLCCRCDVVLDRPLPLLHMAMDLELPCLVLQKIATFFPNDMYPCPSTSPKAPLHFFLSHYSPEEDSHAICFLLYMLDFNPCAAQESLSTGSGKRGKPLPLAIQHGYAWKSMYAIERIVHAAPWVLHEADEETRLLPFQLAASTECIVKDTVQVDVIYSLLRAAPSVIHE